MKTNTKHDDRELTLETLEIGYHREFTSSTSVFLFVFVFVCFIFDSLANVSVHANSLWNPPLQKLLWDWTAKSISKAPGQLINGPVQISKGLSFLFDPGFVRKADFSPNELILNNFCCLLYELSGENMNLLKVCNQVLCYQSTVLREKNNNKVRSWAACWIYDSVDARVSSAES